MKKSDIEADEAASFFSCAQKWVNLYTELGSKVRGLGGHAVTPYMHILVYHLPRMLERYGSIATFSCQGE